MLSDNSYLLKSLAALLLVALFLFVSSYIISIRYPLNYENLTYGTNFSLLFLFIFIIFFHSEFPEWLNKIIYKKTNLIFLFMLYTNLFLMKQLKFLMLLGAIK